jgi:hypothetical protein
MRTPAGQNSKPPHVVRHRAWKCQPILWRVSCATWAESECRHEVISKTKYDPETRTNLAANVLRAHAPVARRSEGAVSLDRRISRMDPRSDPGADRARPQRTLRCHATTPFMAAVTPCLRATKVYATFQYCTAIGDLFYRWCARASVQGEGRSVSTAIMICSDDGAYLPSICSVGKGAARFDRILERILCRV